MRRILKLSPTTCAINYNNGYCKLCMNSQTPCKTNVQEAESRKIDLYKQLLSAFIKHEKHCSVNNA